MREFATLALACAIALSGCAKKPSQITPTYVDPAQYRTLDCDQLALSAQNISRQAAQSVGVQQKNADNDAAMVGVGIILFWPALFFTSRDAATETNLAYLRGSMLAIEQVNNEKKCGLTFQTY